MQSKKFAIRKDTEVKVREEMYILAIVYGMSKKKKKKKLTVPRLFCFQLFIFSYYFRLSLLCTV